MRPKQASPHVTGTESRKPFGYTLPLDLSPTTRDHVANHASQGNHIDSIRLPQSLIKRNRQQLFQSCLAYAQTRGKLYTSRLQQSSPPMGPVMPT